MNELTTNFRKYLLEHGRSEKTATAYSSDVERYISWCEKAYGMAFTASMLNRSDLHDYQVDSRKAFRVRASTWNRYVTSLTVFAAWLGVEIDGALVADAGVSNHGVLRPCIRTKRAPSGRSRSPRPARRARRG